MGFFSEYSFCVMEHPKKYPQVPRYQTCTSYVGGELGKVVCAVKSGISQGTVFFGACNEERNREKLVEAGVPVSSLPPRG